VTRRRAHVGPGVAGAGPRARSTVTREPPAVPGNPGIEGTRRKSDPRTTFPGLSELSSGLTPARLPADRLPAYAPHHAAKHKLIREYANVWLPKLGFSYPQTVIVDGYSSAGRYQANQHGSPLILLHAYLGRDDRDKFKSPPHFIFIEERKAFAQHLQAEIDDLDLKGATVDVLHGSYVASFPRVVLWLAASTSAASCRSWTVLRLGGAARVRPA
jgi:hypothetical protein